MRSTLSFICGAILVAAVAGYGGYVAGLRLIERPTPVVKRISQREWLADPNRAPMDLRELMWCMDREMSRLPSEVLWRNRGQASGFIQSERAMAYCLTLQRKALVLRQQ